MFYAAYTLLQDHLGFRWYMPGEIGEHIPETPTATLKAVSYRHAPHFETRMIINDQHPDQNAMAWWLLRNRASHLGSKIDRFSLRAFSVQKDSSKFAERMRSAGIQAADMGHQRPFGHSFSNLTKPLIDKNPHWRSLQGGYRIDGQVTLHANGLTEFVTEKMNRFFEIAPDWPLWTYAPDDGGAFSWSEDPVDRQWDGNRFIGPFTTKTDRYYHAVAELARNLKRSHPEKYILAYAYQTYKFKPVRMSGRIPENVLVELTHQQSNVAAYMRPLDDPTSINQTRFRKHLEAWPREAPGRAIYRSHIGSAKSMMQPAWHVVVPSYRYLRQLGYAGVRHGVHRPWAQNGLTVWLMPAAAWNTEIHYNRLLSDYCRAFGRAAPHMETYYRRLTQAAYDSNVQLAMGGMDWVQERVFTDAVIRDVERHLAAARDAVRKAAARRRLRLVTAGWELQKLFRRYQTEGLFNAEISGDGADAKVTFSVAHPELIRDWQAWRKKTDEAGFADYFNLGSMKGVRKPENLDERALDAVVLTNDHLEAVITPQRAGRVAFLKDLRTGKQLFREPRQKATVYGYADGLLPGYGTSREHGSRGPFELIEHGNTRAVVEKTVWWGARLRRTYTLDGANLRIKTHVTNVSDHRNHCRLITKPYWRIADNTEGDVGYVRQPDGSWQKLDFLAEPATTQWLCGTDMPAGAWAVADAEGDVALINHFDPSDVWATLFWEHNARGGTLEILGGLWTLDPGNSFTFEHRFEVVHDMDAVFGDAEPLTLEETNWW